MDYQLFLFYGFQNPFAGIQVKPGSRESTSNTSPYSLSPVHPGSASTPGAPPRKRKRHETMEEEDSTPEESSPIREDPHDKSYNPEDSLVNLTQTTTHR